MTLSTTIEARLRHRERSSVPSAAAGKVLGVQPRNPAGKARFSSAVHWGYGLSWGVGRGLISTTGLGGRSATAAHFAMVWGAEQALLPSLELAPAPWNAEPIELAIDAFHHAVYAIATGLAFAALEPHTRPPRYSRFSTWSRQG